MRASNSSISTHHLACDETLEISSSNFPRFDRNMNTGQPVGYDTEAQVAHQTIFHNAKYPSHVILPIIDGPATT